MTHFITLTSALKQGDPAAFDFVFKEYYASLLFYANKILHNEEDARDVVSEVFLKLWQNKERLDDAFPITPFLFTSARNLCIDRYRANKASPLEFPRDIPYDPEEEACFTLQLDRVFLLREAIDQIHQLPPIQKKVLQLNLLEERSIADIAFMLGKKANSISNAKIKGLDKLKESLTSKHPTIDFKDILLPLLILAFSSFPKNL